MNNSLRSLKYLRTLLQADFLVLLKNKRALFVSFGVPLYLLIIIDKAGAKLANGDFLVVIALAITVGLMSASIMGYSVTVARDRERDVFQRLRVTPAPTWTIMTSRLLVQEVANLVVAFIVLVAGAFMHHLSFSAVEYIEVILMATLGGAVFLAIGQALVGLIKSATTVGAVGNLLYAVLVFSGILGSTGVLSGTIQDIVKWTPASTVITVFQTVLHHAAWNQTIWLNLLACFGYIVVCSFIGIKWFKWDAQ